MDNYIDFVPFWILGEEVNIIFCEQKTPTFRWGMNALMYFFSLMSIFDQKYIEVDIYNSYERI